jgi:hypothetical protein
MHRAAGLKVAAVLLVLFAILWIAATVPLITIVVSYSYAHSKNRYALIAMDCAVQAIVACLAILMGYASLGLARD